MLSINAVKTTCAHSDIESDWYSECRLLQSTHGTVVADGWSPHRTGIKIHHAETMESKYCYEWKRRKCNTLEHVFFPGVAFIGKELHPSLHAFLFPAFEVFWDVQVDQVPLPNHSHARTPWWLHCALDKRSTQNKNIFDIFLLVSLAQEIASHSLATMTVDDKPWHIVFEMWPSCLYKFAAKKEKSEYSAGAP